MPGLRQSSGGVERGMGGGGGDRVEMNSRTSVFPSGAPGCESIRAFLLHLPLILMLSLLIVNAPPPHLLPVSSYDSHRH